MAWELLVESGETITPKEMANLLFSETNPYQCYAAHCLLSDDKLYFKQKADAYETRTAAQVSERKHQIEVETQKAKGQQEFFSSHRTSTQG